MKRILLFGQLMLMIFFCAAQSVHVFNAKLSAGIAVPVGNFASKSQNNFYAYSQTKSSGLAQVGAAAQISFEYKLNRSFGMSLLLAGQENKQDAKAFERNLKESMNSTDNYRVTTDYWKIIRLMIGGFYEARVIANKLFFRPEILFGGLKTSIPSYNFFDITSFAAGGQRKTVSLPLLFCFQINSDIQLDLSNQVFLFTDLGFFHAFGKSGYQIINNNGTQQYITNNIPLTSINFLVGIGYRF